MIWHIYITIAIRYRHFNGKYFHSTSSKFHCAFRSAHSLYHIHIWIALFVKHIFVYCAIDRHYIILTNDIVVVIVSVCTHSIQSTEYTLSSSRLFFFFHLWIFQTTTINAKKWSKKNTLDKYAIVTHFYGKRFIWFRFQWNFAFVSKSSAFHLKLCKRFYFILLCTFAAHALPTRWYSVYTLIYQTVCAKWYCIQKQKWYYRTAVRFMVSFFFQHQQYALFTALQFHFLRLICINPNNFTAGFVSGNESRKTITNPKLLMMR